MCYPCTMCNDCGKFDKFAAAVRESQGEMPAPPGQPSGEVPTTGAQPSGEVPAEDK